MLYSAELHPGNLEVVIRPTVNNQSINWAVVDVHTKIWVVDNLLVVQLVVITLDVVNVRVVNQVAVNIKTSFPRQLILA